MKQKPWIPCPYCKKEEHFDDSPKALTGAVKRAAKLYGADLVGVAGLHPSWIYSKAFNVLSGDHAPKALLKRKSCI